MKKTILIITSLMFSLFSSAQNYIWTPDGTLTGTAGGDGIWNNTDALWWDGSQAIAGTPLGSGASQINVTFNGNGTIVKVAETRFANPPDTAIIHTINISPNSHYTFLGGNNGGLYFGSAHIKFNVASNSSLILGGNGNTLQILGASSLSAGPGIVFGGGGPVDIMNGTMIRPNSGNSRMTIQDGTKVTFHENSIFTGPAGNFDAAPSSYSRIAIQGGTLEVDGGTILAGYHGGSARSATRAFGINIGNHTSLMGNLILTSGTITALGDPRSTATNDSGIAFGYQSGEGDMGGRADLNGGTLIVSNIRTQAKNAILSLNGVLLKPTTALSVPAATDVSGSQLQGRLDRFINGFRNDNTSHVVIGSNGVVIDTSMIDAVKTNGAATIASVMRGTGDLTLQGENKLQMNVVHTYTGNTSVLAGTLMLGNVNSIAASGNVFVAFGGNILTARANGDHYAQTLQNLSGAGDIHIGDTALTLSSTSSTVFSGNVLGTGAIIKTGIGTLDVSGMTGNYQSLANITVSQGTLLGNAGALDTDIVNNANLTFKQIVDTNSTRTKTITGTGNIIKTGGGTVYLSAATGGGNIVVEGGSLLLSGGALLNGGNIIAQQGTTLGGHGAITGPVGINDATLQAGDNSVSSLSISGDLNLNDATLSFGLFDATSSTSLQHLSGALNTSGTIKINILSAISGTYNLGNIGSLSGANLTILGWAANSRQGGTLSNDSGNLILTTVNDYSRYITWTNNAATSHWNTSDKNWTGSNNVDVFSPGDSITINNNTPGANITIDGTVIISDLIVTGSADLTLGGAPIITNTSSYAPGEITAPTGKLVKDGSGLLTLDNNAPNYFEGGIDLRGGILAFTHSDQLITGASGITFINDATLRAAADGLTLTTSININPGANATIDTRSNRLIHAARIIAAENSALIKSGSGTLVIDMAVDQSGYLGTTVIQEGTLGIHTEDVIHKSWSTAITGSGNLEKSGDGSLTLLTAPTHTGSTNILGGVLRTGGHDVLGARSSHYIAPGATLDLQNYNQRIVDLHNAGTIMLTANVNNSSGMVTSAPTLIVGGDASGDGTLFVKISEAPAGEGEGSPEHPIIIVEGENTSDYAFVYDQRFVTGNYDWRIVRDGKNYVFGRQLSPEIPVIGASEAAVTLAAHAAYATLAQRISVNQLLDQPGKTKQGSNLWFNTLYQHDKVSTSLYDGATADSNLFMLGYDYTGKDRVFTIGFAFDYVRTETDLPSSAINSSSDTDLYGINMYLSHQPGTWYANLIVRLNNATTNAHIPQTPSLAIKTSGLGASLEFGLNWKLDSGWLLQPQFQYIGQSISTDPIDDSFGRRYIVNSTNISNIRAGLLLSKEFRSTSGKRSFLPYLRVSYVNELKGTTYIGSMDLNGRHQDSYENDLGGTSTLVNGGGVLRLSDSLNISADFSAYLGGPVERYSLNLGMALRW